MSTTTRRTLVAAVAGLAVLSGCGSTVSGTAAADPDATAVAETTTEVTETSEPPETTEEDEPTTGAEPTTEAVPTAEAVPFDPGPITITTRRSSGGLSADLCALVTAEEVGAALGGTSEPLEESSFVCTMVVGDVFALLSYSEPDEGAPVPAATQVGGNTTLAIQTDEQTCEVVVALNADQGAEPEFLDAYVLSPSSDPCAAALALVTAAFPRTPA